MNINDIKKTDSDLIDLLLKEYQITIDKDKFIADKNLGISLAKIYEQIKSSDKIIRVALLPDMIYDLHEIIEEFAHDRGFTYQYQDSSAYIEDMDENAINSFVSEFAHLAEDNCNLLFLHDKDRFYLIEGYEGKDGFHTFDELDIKLSSIEIGITTHEIKHKLINEAYVYGDPNSCYPAEYNEKEITNHTYVSLEDIGISIRDIFTSNYNEAIKIIEEIEKDTEREA